MTRAAVQLATEKGRLTVAENERNRTHLQLLRAMDLQDERFNFLGGQRKIGAVHGECLILDQ